MTDRGDTLKRCKNTLIVDYLTWRDNHELKFKSKFFPLLCPWHWIPDSWMHTAKNKLKERMVRWKSKPYSVKVSTGPPGKGVLRFSNFQQPVQERIWTCEPPNPIAEVLVSVTLSSWAPAWKLTLARAAKRPFGPIGRQRLVIGGKFQPEWGFSKFPVRLFAVHKEQRLPQKYNRKCIRVLFALPVDGTRCRRGSSALWDLKALSNQHIRKLLSLARCAADWFKCWNRVVENKRFSTNKDAAAGKKKCRKAHFWI